MLKMTITPTFPPIVLTGDDATDISDLVSNGDIVALYNNRIYKIFHAIPSLESIPKPLAKVRVVYIDCHAIDMSDWDGDVRIFGKAAKEITKGIRLEERIRQKINIPNKDRIILD